MRNVCCVGLDNTCLEVASFRQSLQIRERIVLSLLEQRRSKKSISLLLGISTRALNCMIQQMGNRFLHSEWEES